MAVILISGGTGLVGRALTDKLILDGHEVRLLSRNPTFGISVKSFYWNIKKNEIDEKAFEGINHIVHLAGAGIAAERWTAARKKEIIDSRVKSMKLITSIVIKKNIHLTSFVGASAVGFYGMTTSENIYQETHDAGNDFLSEACVQWEDSYNDVKNFSSKTSILRTGVVLSNQGGALKRLGPLFKSGLGSAIGSGKQYLPWIHIDDLVSVYIKALFDPTYNGIYNAVSSEHLTNKQFSEGLAKALSKSFFMPNVPDFALKIILGKMADILLKGSRVSNQKLTDSGFHFRFPTLNGALKEIISGNKF